jgi:hypothetical protein
LIACGGDTSEQHTTNPPPLASTNPSASAGTPTPPAVDKAKELQKLASQAFEFGYSPLFMERQKRTMTTNVRLPLATFAHASKLPKAEDADVLPSLDTLLSSAWLELKDGAWLLKLPDMGDRWFAIEMFDAYGEPIGVVGRKTTGTKAQQIAITSPAFKGTLPAGAKEIKSTTSTVWLLGRTRVTSDNDVAKVSALLKQWSLSPIPPAVASKDFPPAPLGRPQDLKFGGPEIFDELGEIMKAEPPPPDVKGALADFAKAGIGPGLSPNKSLPQEDLASLSQGVKDGADDVDKSLDKLVTRKNGWDLDATFGQRGAEPSKQSAYVLRGLDAIPVASEALVYIARVDDGDRVLSGAHDYAIHFDKAKLPPAKAFWSITVYSSKTAGLVPGAKRSAVNDSTVKKNPDGSIDVVVQPDAPSKNDANWIPAPKGDAFMIALRVYQPADDAASWEAPVVKRVK